MNFKFLGQRPISLWLKISNKYQSFGIGNWKLEIGNSRATRERGFTLVELLIVVAIIGILATLLSANFIGVRQRARDGQRKSDLRQIQSALELYRSDQASYPNVIPSPNCPPALKSPDCSTSTYMQKIPIDPAGASYTYSSNGTIYSVIACLENGNDSQKDAANVAPCNGTTNFSYTVQNP